MPKYYKVKTIMEGYHVPGTEYEYKEPWEFFAVLGNAAMMAPMVDIEFNTKEAAMWVEFHHADTNEGVAFYIVE